MAGLFGSGGPVRAVRRLSILADVQDLATARLAAINGAASKAQGSMNGAAGAARHLKAALAGFAIGAAGGFMVMRKLTRIGTQLDTTFAQIAETANATTEDMAAIRGEVGRIGREMPVTMSETADAVRELSYAGFEAADAVSAMEAVSELAVAGQMNMQEAARAVSSQMNAFNVQAEDVSSTTATLAATFSNSAATIDELSQSMTYAGQTMSMLGFEISETNAALGVMADQGMRGTMAGTALNQAFSKLASEMGPVKEALQAAGLSMDDLTNAEGEMKPMIDVIEIMSDRLDKVGATSQETARWLNDIAGRRGARALMPLIQNTEDFREKWESNVLAQFKQTFREIDQMDEEWTLPEDPVETIRHFREELEAGNMSASRLTNKLQEDFGMEEEAAQIMADMIQDENTEIEELAERLEDVTLQGELTEAQMETLGGRLRWIRGTMQQMAYTMYQGFAPALELVLDKVMGFLRVASEHEAALKSIGLVVAGLTGIFVTATAAVGSMLATTYAMKGLVGLFSALDYAMGGVLARLFLTIKGGWMAEGMMYALRQGLIYATKAMWGFFAGLGPLGWLLLATIALFVIWKKDILGLADEIEWLTEGALWVLTSAFEDIVYAGGQVLEFFREMWALMEEGDVMGLVDLFMEQGGRLGSVIAETIGTAVDNLVTAITNIEQSDVEGAAVSFWDTVVIGLAKAGVAALKWATKWATMLFMALPMAILAGVGNLFWQLGVGLFDALKSGMRDALPTNAEVDAWLAATFLEPIKNIPVIGAAAEAFAGLSRIEQILAVVAPPVFFLVQAVKGLIAVFDALKERINPKIQTGLEWLGEAADGAADPIETITDAVGKLSGVIRRADVGALAKPFEYLWGVIDVLQTKFGEWWDDLSGIFDDVIAEIEDELIPTVEWLIDKIKTALGLAGKDDETEQEIADERKGQRENSRHYPANRSDEDDDDDDDSGSSDDGDPRGGEMGGGGRDGGGANQGRGGGGGGMPPISNGPGLPMMQYALDAAKQAASAQPQQMLYQPQPTGSDGTQIDARTVTIEQSPHITIEGGSARQQQNIRSQVERAMAQTKEETFDDLVDFMLIGGHAQLSDAVGETAAAAPDDSQTSEDTVEGEEGDTTDDGTTDTDLNDGDFNV